MISAKTHHTVTVELYSNLYFKVNMIFEFWSKYNVFLKTRTSPLWLFQNAKNKPNLFYFYHPTGFCTLPADAGTGPKFDVEVYYDSKQDMCLPFLYKGEGGNQNRFQNEKECIRNCSDTPDKTYPTEGEMIVWTYSEKV